ncbi:STAS domain-containing protein [candidate division KSB1 bacterium]
MGVKEKIVGDAAVLTLSGKLMGGNETNEVHDKVKSLIADDVRKVVIDLSKVKWVNSRGLGMLMACFSSLAQAKGDLKLAGTTEKVKSLLMITQIIAFFENYETTDRALAAFKKK